jgi:hydroxypyruvate isomerase
MPRFAANLTMMFNEWSFLDRFAAAADVGFKAVEFLFPYDHKPSEIAACLQRNKLTPALFNLPPGDWGAGERGLAALPERRDEFRQSVQRAIDYAVEAGLKSLHVMSGLADSKSSVAGIAYRDAIRFAAGSAAKHGIDIMIEPINPRDMPGYFLNDFNLAVGIIQELSLPNLKLQFDIYHRQIIHGDVIRGLETLMPTIGHIQIASVPRRNEPGTGELDDFRLFETLDSLDYAGFVGCEYRPAAGTLDGLTWLSKA